MSRTSKKLTSFIVTRYTRYLLAAWTTLILASAAWNIYENHRHTLNRAIIEAETYFDLNLAYRTWNSQAGGLYAPIDKVVPNPYLLVSDREITTTKGKDLTLVNPAYMTRMVFDAVKNKSEMPVICKLTSLQNLNPGNIPDDWEKKALFSFEQGAKRVSELTTVRNMPYLRIIKPFYTEESCLKCHAEQGYKIGDIRGGLSIAIPYMPYQDIEMKERGIIVFTHLLLWMIGSMGLVLFSRSREKQQKQILESEWMFRTISEFAYDWEYWLSEDSNMVFTSPSCKDITGYTQAEFMDNPDLLMRLIHPDDRDLWTSHIDDFKSARHDEKFFRIVAKDGQTKWISHFCGPIYRNDKFLGRRASNRDVTRQMLAEEKLKESERRLAKAQQIAHIGSWEWDIEVNKTYWSDEANRILDLKRLQSGDVYDVFLNTVHPDDKESLQRAIREASYGKQPLRIDYRILLPEGLVRNVRCQSEVEYDNGSLTRMFGTVQDITDIKRLEEQLRQAQKMEAIGTLAGGIAHDFNNILTAIMGYANLLEMNMRGDDPLRMHVEQILKASVRASDLTNSLLTFSRKQVMNPKPVNLNEIINKVDKFLTRLIGEDIEFKTSLTEKELIVMADSGQIEQVLMNLATNARDAMHSGGRLTISSELVELDEKYMQLHGNGLPGRYAVVSATDTGSGMDEETKKRIFEPFFTTKEKGRGTGLGLAIVYGIIKQHNGHIEVYSEPGHGTIFRIYLPLIEATVEEEQETEIAYPEGGTETILVAEDDREISKITNIVLRDFGYKVILAEDGEDAINKYIENKEDIQLVILDMIMPKKSGKEAYEAIRKINPDIKVLFFSGYSADIIQREGILTEKLEFIMKPVTPKDLLRKVRDILDKK